ncbi:sugar transferase [Vagococcus fluvialis]|uniref:sugar transferase n=1 Tax=Vagococcus fluvialis TaxID=2738 RepID=UPI001A8F3C0E|nr:sugar transferase [Vagococcus fluvialis]MBO0442875.1 sugar transferase [Vagococcus fluvialis]
MYSKFIKRILDIIVSLLLLPAIFLIGIVIAILIFFTDFHGVFYNSARLGKDGKNFKMYKFRTMKINAEDLRNEDGSTFNSVNDPRLTKIGKTIRKLSLDELPQIINVLKGDMSFVGPRPDLPEHINLYNGEEKKKLTVLPGITGYNQAYFRNSIEWKERLKNDVYYAENISCILDAKIVLRTIKTVLKRDGVFNE